MFRSTLDTKRLHLVVVHDRLAPRQDEQCNGSLAIAVGYEDIKPDRLPAVSLVSFLGYMMLVLVVEQVNAAA